MGDGDVVMGTVRAVEVGVLDQPYPTSQLVKCKVMGVLDARGAAHFLDHGNLPFSKGHRGFSLTKNSRKRGSHRQED